MICIHHYRLCHCRVNEIYVLCSDWNHFITQKYLTFLSTSFNHIAQMLCFITTSKQRHNSIIQTLLNARNSCSSTHHNLTAAHFLIHLSFQIGSVTTKIIPYSVYFAKRYYKIRK